jgi:flavodoxin
MKPLVVFYSRSGVTRKVAESLSQKLGCDVEEVVDTKNRGGLWGYITSGYGANRKRLTVIRDTKYDPSQYDLVIIGTPVWAGLMSVPIRTYITKNMDKLKRVAFFCTLGSKDAPRIFPDMEELCGKRPVGTAMFRKGDVMGGAYLQKVQQFAAEMGR